MDRLLDQAATGPVYLRRPDLAQLMVDTIHYQADSLDNYCLHAYAIMSNHVHLLVTPKVAVPRLTHSLKSFTASAANRILGVKGRSFWQDESYDRLVRNRVEFERIQKYIEWNPVKAGLVALPEEFPWSSASRSAERTTGERG